MRKQISNAAMAVLVLLFLISALTGASFAPATAAAAAVVLCANLPVMGRTFRAPAWAFFLIGAAVLLAGRAPLSQWAEGLNSMLKTAVILIVMQTLSLAMHQGGYERAVADCLRSGAKSAAGLYCLVMVLSHLLASVMRLGSVVIILAAIGPALAGRMRESSRFIAGAVSWGYCTLFLWAPGTVTVLMSMQVFGLSWQSYFPPAFGLSMLGLGLGAALAFFLYRGRRLAGPEGGAAPEKPPAGTWRKLWELSAVLVVIVAGITALERLGFSTSTGRLLTATLAVSAVWLLLQRRTAPLGGVLRQWWDERLPQNGDLSAFFLSMGIFSAAIQYSGLAGALTRFCGEHQALLGPLALPLLPLAIVAFSLVGLHPFVSVLMVGPILAGMSLPATPLQLGLAMSLGCCLSYMLSPFAGLILALSSGLKESPGRICLRSNLGYALIYYLLAMGVIALLPGCR